ncbi:MAG: FAD-dependent oxidoreductase [Chloroflexota bacterium]
MPSDRVLVIGGGPGGLEAARVALELGAPVTLVESRDRLGGTPDEASYAALTPDFEDAGTAMRRMADAVTGSGLVDVRLSTKVTRSEGAAGAFRVTLSGPGGDEVVDAGAIVVATGFTHFDPASANQSYGYYEFPDVITLPEAERMLKEHRFVKPSTGQPPARVCFVQCVGSRDRRIGNEYCSKVCCGVASKEAIEIRKLLPDCKVTIFYIDMRMYGHWEEQIYWPAQEQYHVNYVRGVISEILPKGDHLVVRGEDTTMGRPMEIAMDVVVLSVGMVPSAGTKEIGPILGIEQDKNGFIQTHGGVLNTVATSAAGIFVAGAAAGPKDLEDTVSMAGAAAAKAVALTRRPALGAAR